MSPRDKPLAWLSLEIKTPPFGSDARIEAGFLMRRLQRGEALGLPHSRPMPSVGPGCHELRIVDGKLNWRIADHIATDAVVILDVFTKETQATPLAVINARKPRRADCGRGENQGEESCEGIHGDAWSGRDGKSAMRPISCSCPTTSSDSLNRRLRSPLGCDGCANVKG